MEQELLQEAVTALQVIAAGSATTWTDPPVLVALLVGLLQCALIAWGIREMGKSNDNRAKLHEETMRKMDAQHEENMTALKTLIERTAPR